MRSFVTIETPVGPIKIKLLKDSNPHLIKAYTAATTAIKPRFNSEGELTLTEIDKLFNSMLVKVMFISNYFLWGAGWEKEDLDIDDDVAEDNLERFCELRDYEDAVEDFILEWERLNAEVVKDSITESVFDQIIKDNFK